MFCISIKFKNEPSVWTLLYNSAESMQNAWSKNHLQPHYTLEDDFGQRAQIDAFCVAGIMFEDMDKSMLAHVERGIHNARTQAKAETVAMSDPVLRTAAMAKQRGPAIFNPVGNGGMHG